MPARVIVEEMTDDGSPAAGSSQPTARLDVNPTVSASACSSPVLYATDADRGPLCWMSDHWPVIALLQRRRPAIIRELPADGNSPPPSTTTRVSLCSRGSPDRDWTRSGSDGGRVYLPGARINRPSRPSRPALARTRLGSVGLSAAGESISADVDAWAR